MATSAFKGRKINPGDQITITGKVGPKDLLRITFKGERIHRGLAESFLTDGEASPNEGVDHVPELNKYDRMRKIGEQEDQ